MKVEEPEELRAGTATVALALVGALFVWRYSDRLVDLPGAVAAVYCIAFLIAVAALRRVDFVAFRWARSGQVFALLVGVLTAAALLVVLVTPEENRVARLPALAQWLSSVEAGDYPWAEHVNAPSSFPFMYVLAWPFDLIGNLGILEVIAIGLLGTILWKASAPLNTRWLRLAIALLLPPLYYEPIVRSELLFNASISIGLILMAERWLDPARIDAKAILLAIAFGLVLSTRTVVGLVWVAYLLYRFRDQLRNGAIFALVVGLVFVCTLAPFILWDSGDFFANGPFTSQSRGSELPTWIAGLAVVASVAAGWTARSLTSIYFRVGLILFVVVTAALAPQLIEDGDAAILSNSNYDLGYFALCVPFLLLSIESSSRHSAPRRKPTRKPFSKQDWG